MTKTGVVKLKATDKPSPPAAEFVPERVYVTPPAIAAGARMETKITNEIANGAIIKLARLKFIRVPRILSATPIHS